MVIIWLLVQEAIQRRKKMLFCHPVSQWWPVTAAELPKMESPATRHVGDLQDGSAEKLLLLQMSRCEQSSGCRWVIFFFTTLFFVLFYFIVTFCGGGAELQFLPWDILQWDGVEWMHSLVCEWLNEGVVKRMVDVIWPARWKLPFELVLKSLWPNLWHGRTERGIRNISRNWSICLWGMYPLVFSFCLIIIAKLLIS